MYRLNRWTVLRLVTLVLAGLASPICGASTTATTPREPVAQRAPVQPAAVTFAAGEAGADRERLQQVALLVSADGNDITRSLLTRFPPTSVQASRSNVAMGLQLPEPGPLSAIIATLALAGFVMVRRFG